MIMQPETREKGAPAGWASYRESFNDINFLSAIVLGYVLCDEVPR